MVNGLLQVVQRDVLSLSQGIVNGFLVDEALDCPLHPGPGPENIVWKDRRVRDFSHDVSHDLGARLKDLEIRVQDPLVQLKVVKDCVVTRERREVVVAVLEPNVGRGDSGREGERAVVAPAVDVLD